jgi:endogenous inhibitor of DNA gyrase (YacG/DUF329 family)
LPDNTEVVFASSPVNEIELPVRCPVCKREFDKDTSPALPFCSERCRKIDLGRWLDEVYQLPVVPDPEADELPDEPANNGQGNGAAQ